MPRAKVEPQIALEERVIEDADLEQQLESWWELRDASNRRTALRKAINGSLESRLNGSESVRVGRFAITAKLREERHVEFDVTSKKRLSIKGPAEESA